MFRFGALSFLAGAVFAATMTASDHPVRMTSERCIVPMELAHGGIDLAYCEDLAASALLRPEYQVRVLRRIARIHAERANTDAARKHLRRAMAADPLIQGVRREYADIANQHKRFAAAFVPPKPLIERQVAGLNTND